ncbi:transglycosylase SLT domain-containing protein [Desulfococcaceae bacterium HSG7]|nr:transglycosylase SLT domain-containing protein [Desulfococcaceae bacterium HSG7]
MSRIKLIIIFLGIFLVATASGWCQRQKPLRTARLPSLISALRFSKPPDFCGETIPADIGDVRERMDKELLLALWDRPQVILWLKRANRYMPIITRALKENQMPDDLKYITVIESALRPHAGSVKGAMGFWQFMPATGRKYGLTINSDLDERRSIFASTRAAVKYLKVLHAQFDSWTLAAAAFNMGEQGLRTAILTQKTDNYFKLYLSLETQRYLFKIIAAKLILSDPRRFRFYLKKSDYYPPLTFDRVEIKCDSETPVSVIAEAAKTYFKMIKDLNPAIRGYNLAKGNHQILIPKGAAQGFFKRLKPLLAQSRQKAEKHVYVVRQGDNLAAIAKRFNVPLPVLFIWNRLDLNKPIHPGDKLIVYSQNKGYE